MNFPSGIGVKCCVKHKTFAHSGDSGCPVKEFSTGERAMMARAPADQKAKETPSLSGESVGVGVDAIKTVLAG